MRVLISDIYQAYKKCHKGKAKSVKAQKYSAMLIDNIFDTHFALQTNTYKPKSYTSFVATNGSKPREIFAASFDDRVVHHYLISRLEKIISHKFIYHSCANQINKGTHFGVNALQKMMRKGDTHYLQLDIFNFFYSIDKKILLSILAKHLKIAIKKRQIHLQQGRDYYQLCSKILTKVRQKNHLSADELAKIPPHKQLKNVAKNKGLPIGNLTSQFFGNVYMHELDIFIKHQLKVKSYVRFADDFVLLGNKTQLEIWQQQIQLFLQTELILKLKSEQILKPVDSGIDFLGYIIYPHYKLVRKRVVHNFYKKLKQWEKENIKNGKIDLNKQSTLTIHSLVASYIGHFKHANSAKLIQSKFSQFKWLALLFNGYKNNYTIKTVNKFASKFSHQLYYFHQAFKGFIVLVQKGKFFTFKQNNLNKLPKQLQQLTIDLQTNLARLHIHFLNIMLDFFQQTSTPYVFISEQGYVHNHLKQRKLRLLFHPQLIRGDL